MNSISFDTHTASCPASLAGGVTVRVALMGYWYGSAFRAGVPATLS
ncbi:MAG TPA: hypothetical protein VK991_11195 [Halomonas sp.]|nr:hypothetical protein [Halomonas sp.]